MIAFSSKYKTMVFLLNKKFVFLILILLENPFHAQSSGVLKYNVQLIKFSISTTEAVYHLVSKRDLSWGLGQAH